MTTSAVDTLRQLPVGEIKPSPLNHRRRFDETKLQELAESIRQKGLVQPVVVRPKGEGWELIVGHRRLKAAAIAGLEEIPALIRELDDESVVELQIIENVQRDDVHPMEEAAGYRYLVEKKRLTIPQIAAKVGRSVKYVYDRMKLLALVPEAQRLFLEGRFEAGHAIILARLKPSDQERAIDPEERGGLWEGEYSLFNPEEKGKRSTDPYEDMKPRSVRELQAWVDEHVRFDPGSEDLPNLFPETAAAVAHAEEDELKLVKITYANYVQPEARVDAERTYGPRSWKKATKPCPHQVLGVVAIGAGRGRAFTVCVEKKKCKVHWGKEIREAAKMAAARAAAPKSSPAPAKEKREPWKIQQEQREKFRKRVEPVKPALLAAAVEKIRALPADATGVLSRVLLDELDRGIYLPKIPAIPRGKTAEDLLRFLVGATVQQGIENKHIEEDDLEVLTKLGFNWRKLLDELAPEEKPAAAAKAKPKKATKKKGGRKS